MATAAAWVLLSNTATLKSSWSHSFGVDKTFESKYWRLIPHGQGLGKVEGHILHSHWMRRPYFTLDRLRMIGRLLALSASCIFPLLFYASLSSLRPAFLTDECQLSESEHQLPWPIFDSCQCKLSLQLVFVTLSDSTKIMHPLRFLRKTAFGILCLPSLWCGQPRMTEPETRWTLRWAGDSLEDRLFCLTCRLAIWCQVQNTSGTSDNALLK